MIPSPQVLYLLHLHHPGSHACPESLCMLRSLLWFRNMPSVLQPSVPEAMCVAPQTSERARGGMQHAHHNAPCTRMLRVTFACAVEPCARAQSLYQSRVGRDSCHRTCITELSRPGRENQPGSLCPACVEHHDLRPRSLPWVMLCDLRVHHSTRSKMI